MLPKLNKVRRGHSISLSKASISCDAALGYLGFGKVPFSVYDYLSVGGEKYKQTPDMEKSFVSQLEIIFPPKRYLTFKRWDRLEEEDTPEAVVFFTKPDVLSGLFHLVQFDEEDVNAVIAPMSTGCTAIITYPLAENRKKNPRSVLGLFEIESRAMFKENLLTLAVPMRKFERIIDFMDETFLTTQNWQKLKKRINRKNKPQIYSQ